MEEIQEIQEILVVPEIKQKKKYPRKPPKNPQYYNEYYHQHNEKVPCEFCGVLVGKSTGYPFSTKVVSTSVGSELKNSALSVRASATWSVR